MPLREQVRYLKRKAGEFRALADTYPTELSGRLREIADEFEGYATALESQLQKKR